MLGDDGSKDKSFHGLPVKKIEIVHQNNCILDLQNVNISLRILYRPVPEALPSIYRDIGREYAEKVFPSITTEVLKAVVVSYYRMFRKVETQLMFKSSNLKHAGISVLLFF